MSLSVWTVLRRALKLGFPYENSQGELGGPAAIRFISHDTCSDCIAKLFRACFCGGIAQLCRAICSKRGIAQMWLCETKYQNWGISHQFVEFLTSLKRHRAISGFAAIVSQYRAIWGH